MAGPEAATSPDSAAHHRRGGADRGGTHPALGGIAGAVLGHAPSHPCHLAGGRRLAGGMGGFAGCAGERASAGGQCLRVDPQGTGAGLARDQGATVNLPASPSGARDPRPSVTQQRVLDRIAAQRERLSARRAQRLVVQAQADNGQAPGADLPLVQRLVWFTREHPVVVAAVAGGGPVGGGRRGGGGGGGALPLIPKFGGGGV